MYEQEMRTYRMLNELAEPDGIVIFGGSDDLGLPLCELKQAFTVEQGLYNRSLPGLSVKDAAVLYETCTAPLDPETVWIPKRFCSIWETPIPSCSAKIPMCSITVTVS